MPSDYDEVTKQSNNYNCLDNINTFDCNLFNGYF